MHLHIVTGTPGQSKNAAVKKIARYLETKSLKVGIGDVEQELLGMFPEYNAENASNKDPLASLIGERAQLEIKDSWPTAYDNAVKNASSDKPDIVIISSCLEYYRAETYEFYSPIDSETVHRSNPKTILTLIDDIYEIYYRLSQAGQVFDIQELIERRFPPSSSSDRNSKDLRRLYKDALIVSVSSMLRVLVWREKEIECGANLARTLHCEHSVLAAKHPIETGVRLLLGATSVEHGMGPSYPVYISHPISRPRRDRFSQGKWPSFVTDLETVVATMSSAEVNGRHVVPVMPTAIDEFRILDDGTYLHPALTPRWQIYNGELLYSQPRPQSTHRSFADVEDFERSGLASIFDPPIDSSGRRVGLPLSDAEVSGILRTLKESIQLQMAGRDHLLVRQCPGFFLYRPLYGEFEFSGGVENEIHTFDQIRKYSSTISGKSRRLIAFIHDRSDVVGLLDHKEGQELPEIVRQASAAIVRASRDLVHQSGGKTKGPFMPKDDTVAEALKTEGIVDKAAKKIHIEMFPSGKEGSIGSERPLPWEKTKKILTRTLEVERVKALSTDISIKMSYTYSQDSVDWAFNMDENDIDTYVDVIKNLDDSDVRRAKAVERARDFFAKGVTDLVTPPVKE